MEELQFFKGYKDESGKYHKTFEITEMTGEVEEQIARKEIKNNGGKVARKILELCITRIGDYTREDTKKSLWTQIIQSLDVADQDYALMKIRQETDGSTITVTHKCGDCGKKLNTEIEMDELELVPYKGIDLIPFDMPKKGIKDKNGDYHTKGFLKRPQGIDREVLAPIFATNPGKAHTKMLYHCIVSVDGIDVVSEKDITNLSLADRKYLDDLLKDNLYGIKQEFTYSCPECDYEGEGTLNFSSFF